MTFYTNKYSIDERKLRGGYYTPHPLAQYLVNWGMKKDTKRVLEPSCGDGNFVIAVLEFLRQKPQFTKTSPVDIVAIELISIELDKARTRTEQIETNNVKIKWICGDFFEEYARLDSEGKFDLIIGNPPFIRFQHFNGQSRELAFNHLRKAGYKPTKLANTWSAFVQLGIELLKPSGCLAMVVPAELLQVTYANQLRERLSTEFEHIFIIGFKKLVFAEIQQEVFLLLADGKREQASSLTDIHTIELLDGKELLNADNLNSAVAHIPAKHSRKGMKWTSLFLEESAFQALDNAEKTNGLIPLGNLAEVDIGIVTGRNSFFILDKHRREELEALSMTLPIIGRTSALKSIIYKSGDFEGYENQYPCFLLNLNGIESDTIPQLIIQYLELGEKEGIHSRYKCRVRKRWYDVPSIYVPDAFLFRQIHRYPILVVNKAGVTSTDTIHRIRLKEGVNPELLAALFFNSLTLAWAEVCGRSYGGGVLELEPREAEELPIPYTENIKIESDKVDKLLRRGYSKEALDYVDSIVLKGYLGFDNMMLREIRKAWEQLRDRRIARK